MPKPEKSDDRKRVEAEVKADNKAHRGESGHVVKPGEPEEKDSQEK